MKKIGEVEKFYIDKNKDNMTPDAIAKVIGCTSRTIYNYLNKGGRTAEERETIKSPENPVVPNPPIPEQPQPISEKLPPKGLGLVAIKKHGTGGATSMTSSQSQVGDTLAKRGPKKTPDYISVINPDK